MEVQYIEARRYFMNNTHKYKYLVVEDEHLIRRNVIKKIESLSLPLELIGEASNGKDAIVLIEKHLPSLVITDIKMPQYDGLELIKYIQQNHPHMKAIILSGYNDFKYAQAALKYNAKDFLLKPIKKEELNNALQNIIIMLDSENAAVTTFCADPHNLSQEDLCRLMESFLRNNYQSEISLADIATNFGFTIEYLGKIFKKYTGEPPLKYLTRIRINEAKQLLINQPDLEIHKIGELVGYKDAFYFSRVFKLNVGMHPSDYRLQHL